MNQAEEQEIYSKIPVTGDWNSLCLLVGGYPTKGTIPFNKDTLSGKRLHKILQELHFDPVIMDLWKSKEEEDVGKVSPEAFHIIGNCLDVGGGVYALGRYVYNILQKAFDGSGKIKYAPHPASRRPQDLVTLKQTLCPHIESYLKWYGRTPEWTCIRCSRRMKDSEVIRTIG